MNLISIRTVTIVCFVEMQDKKIVISESHDLVWHFCTTHNNSQSIILLFPRLKTKGSDRNAKHPKTMTAEIETSENLNISLVDPSKKVFFVAYSMNHLTQQQVDSLLLFYSKIFIRQISQ